MATGLTEEHKEIHERLLDYYPPGEADEWMSSPHPQLEGKTPNSVIEGGDAESVVQILDRLDADAYL